MEELEYRVDFLDDDAWPFTMEIVPAFDFEVSTAGRRGRDAAVIIGPLGPHLLADAA
jgi:hypothetical protein